MRQIAVQIKEECLAVPASGDLFLDVHQRVTRMPPLLWAAEIGQDALIDPLLRARAADSLTTGDVGFLRKSRFCTPEARARSEKLAKLVPYL